MNNLSTNTVLNFAKAMQDKLDENAFKGGLEHCTTKHLLKRLRQEIGELERAIGNNKTEGEIIREAADVGNFVMMIADNYEQEGGQS